MSKKYIDALRVFNGEYAMLHNSEELKTVFMNGKMVRGVEEDWGTQYFTLKSLEDGNTISFIKGPGQQDGTYKPPTNTFYYSLDNGETWVQRNTSTSWQLNAGDTVLIKANASYWAFDETGFHSDNYYDYAWHFTSSKTYKARGNIMSLLYGDNFLNATTLQHTCTFKAMFQNSSFLTDASHLVLPATSLAGDCYCVMFDGCTSLTEVPSLPATTLAEECYHFMFGGCTSLTTAPELPATTLAQSCYHGMFANCTSLASAPTLYAQTMAVSCYEYMFKGCTSLVNAPQIEATSLATRCFYDMFNCCTSLTEAPSLPVTTLKNFCYAAMFRGCVSLTSAPVLPATTLTQSCYNWMFYGCTSLNYVKAMFTTLKDSQGGLRGTYQWMHGVSATGTFVKNTSATWTDTGENAVPSGWTIRYASS